MINSIIICASGNSIRQGDNLTPSIDLPIWRILNSLPTISINWGYRFFNPTIAMYGDYQFYITEKEKLDNHHLIVGKKDSYYTRRGSLPLGKNVILLPTSGKWNGLDSWKTGVYVSQLTGIAAITLSYILGFKNIYLLGYDGCEIDGKTHFYQGDANIGVTNNNGIINTGVGKNKNGKYNTSTYDNEKNLNKWFEPLLEIPSDIKIYNVSPQSRIHTFPKITYSEFFEMTKNNIVLDQEKLRNEIRTYIQEKIK